MEAAVVVPMEVEAEAASTVAVEAAIPEAWRSFHGGGGGAYRGGGGGMYRGGGTPGNPARSMGSYGRGGSVMRRVDTAAEYMAARDPMAFTVVRVRTA